MADTFAALRARLAPLASPVLVEGHGLIYPTVRLDDGRDFQVQKDGLINRAIPGSHGMTCRDATQREMEALEIAVSHGWVQVLALSRPGFSSQYGEQRVLSTLALPDDRNCISNRSST